MSKTKANYLKWRPDAAERAEIDRAMICGSLPLNHKTCVFYSEMAALAKHRRVIAMQLVNTDGFDAGWHYIAKARKSMGLTTEYEPKADAQ